MSDPTKKNSSQANSCPNSHFSNLPPPRGLVKKNTKKNSSQANSCPTLTSLTFRRLEGWSRRIFLEEMNALHQTPRKKK
ncbi:hypothetical protein P3X46_018340 [Hevea brasiliensis]|uniref:Uncharacterized protein n=1 Tax=Hevea brasiliensis TaxID=3981 RepID=A0ABQ9LTK5_HEVBR|nr:hypothetical protein P3X46_018340 [Hevea brasiliensis]